MTVMNNFVKELVDVGLHPEGIEAALYQMKKYGMRDFLIEEHVKCLHDHLKELAAEDDPKVEEDRPTTSGQEEERS